MEIFAQMPAVKVNYCQFSSTVNFCIELLTSVIMTVLIEVEEKVIVRVYILINILCLVICVFRRFQLNMLVISNQVR